MKKKIIITITIITLILATIIIFILTTPNTNPLYGKFTYINEDGSTAIITLTESTIHIENLEREEYENQEKGAALSLTINYLRENNLPVELGEEFGEIQQSFMDDMDFQSLFENKVLPISEVIYDEIHNIYNYFIDNPLEDGSPGMRLWVDINRKELNIGLRVFILSQ